LGKYEQECEKWRNQHVFSFGNWAGIGCSLGASVLAPVFYLLQRRHDTFPPERGLLVSPKAALAIWGLGVLLIVFLWIFFVFQTSRISGKSFHLRMPWRWTRPAPGHTVQNPQHL
jgi:hypothetical protein